MWLLDSFSPRRGLPCPVTLSHSPGWFAEAISSKRTDVLRELRDRGHPWSADSLSRAVGTRDRYVVARCLALGCPVDVMACAMAASMGDVAILEELDRSGGTPCLRDSLVCAGAARSGQVRALRWLRGRGARWDWRTCDGLARMGDSEALRWAISAGCPVCMRSFATAAAMSGPDASVGSQREGKGGSLEGHIRGVMELVEEHASPKPSNEGRIRAYRDAMRAAARRGRLEIVEWLLSRAPDGVFVGTSYCDAAARGGCTAVLGLLVTRYGLEWGPSTSAIAAAFGNMGVLSYCLDRGCGWDQRLYETVWRAQSASLERVLRRHRPGDAATPRLSGWTPDEDEDSPGSEALW